MLGISGFIDEIDAKFEEQTRIAKEIGLKYAEVRSANGTFVGLHTPDEIRGYKQRIDELGLKVSSLASPIGKVPIAAPFEQEWERFLRFTELAAQFETKNMRVFSFFIPADENADDYSEEVLSRMKRMAEHAKSVGITLLHENEKGVFGDVPRRCLLLAKEIDNPNFRLIFDFANFVQCKQNVMEAYEMLKPYIAYFHVKDELATTSESVPAGQGDGEIEAILSLAIAGGYKGFLSLEPHLVDFAGLASLETDPHKRNSTMSGEEAFRTAYDALLGILARIG